LTARFDWALDDPEIVSDMLFALANVWSIARTTYLMPAFEVLGPLQISLARMLGDITRFLVLFTLVGYTRPHMATHGHTLHNLATHGQSVAQSDTKLYFNFTNSLLEILVFSYTRITILQPL